MEKIFGKFGVTVSMFLEEFTPWNIHSDFHKNDAKPYFAVLVPLDFDDKITHTIVFNELGTEKDWKTNLSVHKVQNYTKYQRQLLSHIDEELLSKVSISSVHRWKVGKMIAWHRKLLHTSDNFHMAGLKKKIALVLFLNNNV